MANVREIEWKPDLRQLSGASGGIIVVILILVALLTSVYTVSQDELGVVQRFGKFVRTTEPGLNFKLPFWIETVQKPAVQRIFKEEFGFRTLKPGVRTTYAEREMKEEALMLCGDLNCAMVEWIVQYKIKDPVAYLFNVRDVRKTIRDVSEAVLRNIAGDSSVDEVLTMRRIEIDQEAQVKMQQLLDAYACGISIVTVKLQDVNPPQEVKAAFNEVNEAKQDRERFVNEAWQEYNREVPKAQGEAEKMIQEAEAYAINRTNSAKGDAARFVSVWEEYKDAKDVTRRRIYIETIQDVLPEIERKYIIDESQRGILPFLPLTKEGGQK
jgi:membrane protease subunit HflK